MQQDTLDVRLGFIQARRITKEFAKTFYFASHFLPKEKRYAAYSVYAICRIGDEAADAASQPAKKETLERLTEKIHLTYEGKGIEDSLLAAFHKTIHAYKIPKEYFLQLMDGMRMDLVKTRYLTFAELYDYCYKVAGVVGLIMLEVLGYRDKKAQNHAISLGIAMQLTNILRDIKEDYLRGRIYLPQEEMRSFGVEEAHIAQEKINDNFKALLKFQINRAKEYYANAQLGIEFIDDQKSRLVASSMKDMYAAILNAIENNNYNVFSKRAAINSVAKLVITSKILFNKRR
jgi:phytoene synthase